MKVRVRTDIYNNYVSSDLDINNYLKNIIVFLSLKYCRMLRFDFMLECSEENSLEVEIEQETINLLYKFFNSDESIDKVINTILVTGIMFGGVI